MRRKIELYIDGKLADLDDQGLILMNYALTDLQKPTVVRNSFSKQVTLPGTPANDAIFSHANRVDRVVAPGSFNPLERTPFKIYADSGEVLQSGYLKLDGVTCTGAAHTFTVTLYGGIGSLLYGLSYSDAGDKLSLADLTYNVADASFYATINKNTVAAAWARLYNGTGSDLWDIINFAPCYNGIPNNFDANKARIQGSYDTVVELSRKYTEWETRDLRSWLQRPAVRVKAVLDAIVSAAAAKGHTVSLDPAFFNASNPYYSKTWMLLPMLSNFENKDAGQVGEASSVVTGALVTAQAEIPLDGKVKVSGNTFSSDANGKLDFSSFDASYYLQGDVQTQLKFDDSGTNYTGYLNYDDGGVWKGSLVSVQVQIQVGTGGTAVFSKPCIFGEWNGDNDPRLAQLLSMIDTSRGYVTGGNRIDNAVFAMANFQNVSVSASDTVYIRAFINVVSDDASSLGTTFRLYTYQTSGSSYQTGSIKLYATGGSLTLNAPASIGSNVTVTKAMLLSDTGTPADFLLSYCRMFGLRIVETTPGVTSILARNTFYNGTTKDLTRLLDRSNRKIVPLLFDKKWQRLAFDMVESTKASSYKKQYGKDFGAISLDTGLEFNADTEQLMSGSVFKGGVSGKQDNPLFYDFYDSSDVWWNPALINGYKTDAGTTYPQAQAVTPLNAAHPGYDMTPKPFGFTVDNVDQKPVELAGMLVFFNGVVSNPGMWFLTDDYPSDAETPCWQMPGSADSYSLKAAYLPVFTRYYEATAGTASLSLDFGTPEEIYDPDVTVGTGASIYTRFWNDYLVDLYDASAKTLTAKVNFYGTRGNLLAFFRDFYFYEGSIWALNKITNFSLTTYDPVECEFVQVKDTTDYTAGQTIIDEQS